MSFIYRASMGPSTLLVRHLYTSVPRPTPHREYIQSLLSQFSLQAIDQEECISNCVQHFQESLPQKSDFSEQSSEAVNTCLTTFSDAINEVSCLNPNTKKCLESGFRRGLYDVVEKQWAVDIRTLMEKKQLSNLAESFHTIINFSNEKEKIVAAVQWTHDYFTALNQFNQWRTPSPLNEKVLEEFLKKTSDHLCHVHENKLKGMLFRAENDPISFEAGMKVALEKADNDPASLCGSEQEYLEFMQTGIEALIQGPSHGINKICDLLQKCVRLGFILQKCKLPILGAEPNFAVIFSKAPTTDTTKE